MKVELILEKLRMEVAQGKRELFSLDAADAKLLLEKINSLEGALADLLRSIYAKPIHNTRTELAI